MKTDMFFYHKNKKMDKNNSLYIFLGHRIWPCFGLSQKISSWFSDLQESQIRYWKREQFSLKSVTPIVLIRSISYLYIAPSILRRCVAFKVSCKISKFEFLAFLWKDQQHRTGNNIFILLNTKTRVLPLCTAQRCVSAFPSHPSPRRQHTNLPSQYISIKIPMSPKS